MPPPLLTRGLLAAGVVSLDRCCVEGALWPSLVRRALICLSVKPSSLSS